MSNKRTSEWSAKVRSVYEKQGRELWALLYAHCCDAERANDALQEAFVRLQEQNGSPIRNLRAWLLQVGRNWLRDVARRQRKAARPNGNLDALAGSTADPSFLVANEEVHARVRETLAQMRQDDREVLVLRYGLGWSSNRMADVLGTTAPAVDMRLSRARQRLAESLQMNGIDHEHL